MFKFILIICLLSLSTLSFAAQHQYQVSLLRAAPGNMPILLKRTKSFRQNNDVLIMRHSQGDHWDIMLLAPKNSRLSIPDFSDIAAFQHDFYVKSDWSWKNIQQQSKDAGLFHIEMFHAAVGKKQQLLKQRQMENSYYQATGRDGNIIFETILGNDMDNFTLGFYENMQVFATDPNLPDVVFEQAAKDAGFESRSDIGLYLRQFVARHYDTLAVPVK